MTRGFITMPIYEYICTHCKHQFDELQKIGEPPLEKCPMCAERTLTKLVSAAGFQLKGTGWYATDFKTKTEPATKAEPTKDSSAASKAATKEDSK
jgi:putative FmdB family regulatory protein